MNAMMSPIPTRVYRLVTVTPRQTSAMTPSDGKWSCLPGICASLFVCLAGITPKPGYRSGNYVGKRTLFLFHGGGITEG